MYLLPLVHDSGCHGVSAKKDSPSLAKISNSFEKLRYLAYIASMKKKNYLCSQSMTIPIHIIHRSTVVF